MFILSMFQFSSVWEIHFAIIGAGSEMAIVSHFMLHVFFCFLPVMRIDSTNLLPLLCDFVSEG